MIIDNNYLFSVIVLFYNKDFIFRDSIGSILAQNYKNIELILVDDGSSVFNEAMIREFISENKKDNISNIVIQCNKKNLGTVRCANLGLGLAHGNYIKLLAADDALYDELSLDNARSALDKSESGIVVSGVMACDSSMKEICLFRENEKKRMRGMSAFKQYCSLCVRNPIPAPGVFFRRDCFKTNGLFDEEYKLLEDWPMWLRVTRSNRRLEFADFIGTKYRKNVGTSTSSRKQYLLDKRKVFSKEIVPYRRRIGFSRYCVSFFSSCIRTSPVLRKAYEALFR